MKKYIPLLVLLLGAVWVASTLVSRKPATAFDVMEFGKLPVLTNGRIKPMDTVARSSLLMLQEKQTVMTPAGEALGSWELKRELILHPESKTDYLLDPILWLLDVLYNAEKADTYRMFRVDNPDVLTLFNLIHEDGLGKVRFSYNQLKNGLGELMRQSELAQSIAAQQRTPFQNGVVQLHLKIARYHELKHTLILPDAEDFLGELLRFQDALPAGISAVRAKQQGQPHAEEAFQAMIVMGQRYDRMSNSSQILTIPPYDDSPDQSGWHTTGHALLESFATGRIDSTALAYAGLAHAWRHHQPDEFNTILKLYREELGKRLSSNLVKTDAEVRFNYAQPFYTSMILYVLAFLLAFLSWLKWPNILGRSAFWLVTLAFVATTSGIGARMWLEGRPPVTNLYSSALFVGWGAVLLCLVLELIYKNAIGSVAAGLIGFATLLIAHHLSLSGDTMEMMRAVLDSNFWLSTHVVVITIGYSATFLAGFLALIYILRGLFTTSLDKATADALARMVYGIVCFATLFSLVGTVLGGIWADQSWGRFWGWDPKENGALIIVIWNAIILHARWGGLVKQRGLMSLAVFGNIVTSWSWFGTNMLGIGLHSYGFMTAAFWWLTAFVISQLAVIALASQPRGNWRSFAGLPK
uniref:cytochrome c biogenesis protein n=1 Tax=Cephaloticoccus sp. TaxID=1985742 RepID=UPI0040495829